MMATARSFTFANVRHLLLALLAIGLVLRMGAGCEALAAAPTATAAAISHCEGMPASPDKPMKADPVSCALCHALTDAMVAKDRPVAHVGIDPVSATTGGLVGRDGAPAPPPPKIA